VYLTGWYITTDLEGLSFNPYSGRYMAKRILLVEDEAILAMSEARMIETHGYEVVSAYSGEKAIDLVDSDPTISLILMDIDLGEDMDGTEAAEKIQEKHEIPIVFLTSHAEKEFVDRAKRITNYGYVLKNSGEFVLIESINMAFTLFNAYTQAQEEKENLRESEEKFRTLMNQTIDMLFLHDLDGRIIDVNETGVRQTGYSREELLSMSIPDLDPDYHERENGGRFWKLLDFNQPLVFEARIKRKDGSPFPIEIALSKVTIGGRTYIMTLSREITERKQAEEALNLERLFLSTVLDTIEEAIVICDNHGRIVRFNEAARQLHGLPEKPIPAEQWAEYYDLYKPDGVTPLPTEEIPLFRALQGEHVHNAEIVVAPKGSAPHSLLCNGHQLMDRTGKKIGAVIAMRDKLR
jgi:PAS domain S-box-containing protein